MVQYHLHTFPTATVAEAEAGLRDDIALSPASLYGATLPILIPDPPGGTGVIISDLPPPSPTPGDLYWKSNSGALYLWYVDVDSAQWIQVNGGEGGTGGGGGGGGDDLDTTPVSATGASLARTMPEWLAGAPILEVTGDVLLTANHRGTWVHMMNAVGSQVFLPDDWLPGQSCGIRQMGTGLVIWHTYGNSSIQLPFSRAGHAGISEQYEEIILRVVSNSDGSHAVWGIAGSTY